uniref:hypothetical protein n=1 Tax=Flavobacterium sp. TaxID=239 RepID=UPI00404B6609
MFQKIEQLTLRFYKFVLLFIASALLLDFFFYSTIVTEPIDSVQKKVVDNYKGRNKYVYFVQTAEYQFYVSQEFALGLKNHHEITYEVSLFFGETNTVYPTQNPAFNEIYSLRWFAGLIVPLLFFLSFLLFEFSNKKSQVFYFVISFLLILDTIYIVVF